MKTTSFVTNIRRYTSRGWRNRPVLLTTIAASASAALTALGSPPWSPPVAISKAAVNAQTPAVAINDSGSMVAAWARQQGSVYNVQASINTGGVWSRPVNLSPAGQTGVDPSVAIDNSGTATAVWSLINVIQTSTSGPSGSWTTPVALSDVGTSAISPKVVVDAAGNATAMWVRYDTTGTPAVETADRPAGGNWTVPIFLAAGAPRALTLVVNATGDAAAIWDLGSFVSSTTIYVATRPSGGVWSAPFAVAPSAYRQGGGNVGIAANGDITACWRTFTEIRTADKPAGENWGATTTLYTSSAVSDYPTLAVTPSGDVMASWITYVFNGSSYNYQIRTSARPAGGGWSAPALLTNNKEYDTEVHAGTTPGGSFVLTWVNDNRLTIESSSRTATTNWTPIVKVGPGSATSLAVGGNIAVEAWIGGSFRATVSTRPVSP